MSEDDRTSALSRGRVAVGWAVAVGGCAALTLVLDVLGDDSDPASEAMLFLALAVGCALVGGRWPALAASALGALSLNYFFTEPLRSLRIARALDVLALLVFLAVSVAVAAVVDTAARRLAQATAARQEADTLEMLNRRVLGGEYDVPHLLALVRDHFGADDAVLVPDATRVGPDDTAAPAARGRLLVLRGVALPAPGRRVLAAFATHLGVLEEREELARQTAAARELEAGNRTRTALLAAVSHDLRTPLAGIRAAADTLQRHDVHLSPADRGELLEGIAGATDRLTAIVADLLDMSRLQTGAVEPVLSAVPLAEVVRDALAGHAEAGRVRVVGPLPEAVADAGLLQRVLANLLGNALGHTDGPVELRAAQRDGRVRLLVVDHGEGVGPERWPQMFEPFQRLGDGASRDGVGLGLAVARGLTEAQHGLLTAAGTPGGGLTMVVELAAAR